MGRRKQLRGLQNNKGIALITAMLITVLASTMAVSIVSKQQIEIRRTANVVDGERAYVFALGVETWVKQLLARDDDKKDSLDEDWATVLPPITVEGGQVSGRIEDMQGRFNLNNLVNDGKRSEQDVQRFQNLLRGLGLGPELAVAVVDWLDKDQDAQFPDGGEDEEYLSRDVPYRAANQLMVSPSELLLVKGFTAEVFEQLAPFVTALPERTAINVNTALGPVLLTLSPNLTQADVASIIELRDQQESFASVDEFLNLDLMQNLDDEDQGEDQEDEANNGAQAGGTRGALDIKSDYFLVDAFTRYGSRGKTRMFSLLVRKQKKVNVVMRAQGVF